MMKNDLESFIFEIHHAPSEILANQPGQFSLSGQIVLHWAAATLKGLSEFQNKVLDHFLPLFLSKKCRDFSPLIKWNLAGVLSLRQLDKFWLWSTNNDRKWNSFQPWKKIVKSHQVNLFLAGFIHLDPLCVSLWHKLEAVFEAAPLRPAFSLRKFFFCFFSLTMFFDSVCRQSRPSAPKTCEIR